MKLVELLAKEMDAWPDGCTCGYCMQANESTEVFFGGPARSIFLSELADDRVNAKVTTAQWQSERDRQKGGEWKRHRGGKQPVADDVMVEVRHRDGELMKWRAREQEWSHVGGGGDIMQYRIISQPQAEEVEVHIPNAKTVEVMDASDRGEGLTRFENTEHMFTTLGIVDQIDGPLAWRDTIIHCQAIIEDCEREIQRNVDLLDAEGLYMQLNAKAGMGYAPSIAAEDWQVGDILEIVANIGDHSHEFKIGEQVKIAAFDRSDDELPIRCDALDGSDFWYIKHAEAKFVNRR